jgi:AsmA protein
MKWFVRILGVLFLVVAVFVVGLLMLPGDRIAQVAVDQLRAQTGREVVLKGETTVSFYPVLGVSTGALEIANADWSESGPFMLADSLKVGVDLVSLIGGDVKITGLEAVNPDLLLEKAKDGRANWEIGVDGVAPSGQPSGSGNALSLSLDRALITGGRLRYLDHAAATEFRVDDLSVDLSWPEYRGGATFEISARPQGASRLTVKGNVADLAALIEGELTQGSIEADAGGGKMTFEGHLSLPVQLAGTLKVNLSDTAAFLAGFGLTGVDLPQGLGRKASAQADVTVTRQKQLSLSELRLTLDQNTFNGDVDVDMAQPVPEVMAKLSAGTLDFSSGSGGGGSADAGAEGWSKSEIDASALGIFNGQVSLAAQGLRVAGLNFGATNLSATVDNSRAVVALSQLSGYSGMVTGQVIANNRNGLSVGGAVKASGVELQTLLTDLVGVSRFTGQADANVDLLGAGNSVHAIMNSLFGKGGISTGRGTIKGIDLDSLMRQGLATGGTTVFDSLTATFDVDKGNLYNKDLLLKLPVISATGEGRVGLGARDIDYLFTPKTGGAEVEGGIVIPVRISGPWSDPKIRPDMEKAIDLNLKEEKDAAKKKVEDKVIEKLGLQPEADQSLEDATKKKLEDEVLKGLQNLFK